jgi:hypothetical protein
MDFATRLLSAAEGNADPIDLAATNVHTRTALILSAEVLQREAGPMGWRRRYRTITGVARHKLRVPLRLEQDPNGRD